MQPINDWSAAARAVNRDVFPYTALQAHGKVVARGTPSDLIAEHAGLEHQHFRQPGGRRLQHQMAPRANPSR